MTNQIPDADSRPPASPWADERPRKGTRVPSRQMRVLRELLDQLPQGNSVSATVRRMALRHLDDAETADPEVAAEHLRMISALLDALLYPEEGPS